MLGVAVVDVLPGGFHARNFGGVFELAEEGFFEFFGGGAGNDASNVHIRVAGAGEAKINYADDFVVVI